MCAPEFGQGAVGYGRCYWHTFVDQTSENYCVEGFMPIVFRQDTRYYTIGRGGSLNGVSITPTDHPHMQRGGVSPTGGWHNPMMADHEDFRVIANAGTLA